MAATLQRHRFTVADYHRLGEAGVLAEDDRVELIDGDIVEMSPIGSSHAGLVNRLTRWFVEHVSDRGVKLPLYASAGVAEVWLVDVARTAIEAHTQPTAGGYACTKRYTGAQRLSIAALTGLEASVDALIGPAR